jgi:hypothetical protein
MEFRTAEPEAPGAAAIASGHQLGNAGPLAGGGRSVQGSPKPASAAVSVAEQPISLAALPELTFAYRLDSAFPIFGNGTVVPRKSESRAAAWLAFKRDTATFDLPDSQIASTRWPVATGTAFVEEPSQSVHTGPAAMAASGGTPGFDIPETRYPESVGRTPGMALTRPVTLPSPAAREDAKTANRKARLTPAFRLSNRPSRLPVFRTTVEKAHMPYGVFAYLETEDHDDSRTSVPGASFPAAPLEPSWPRGDYTLRAFETLDEAWLLPVSAGPYPGPAPAAHTFGEFPYAPELFVVATGINLIGMDYEAFLDTSEPRWRSALKTASGLFRGMMLFIPGILVLSSLLTGCAANGGSLRDGIQNRAAIRVEHDFSTGLDGWYGGRDWSKNWIREPGSGYIRAGQLALYRPTQQLRDYKLEFLGQIDKEGIGWVYRAADLQNYYATKLVIAKPGPSPTMALVRYQVIGGQVAQRVQIPLRLLIHNGRPYRIQQDVAGVGYTTSVEGEVVDFWTDDRLRAGGIGFFGETNDTPHLYWMKVTYNDDFWGKVCATIAPNN